MTQVTKSDQSAVVAFRRSLLEEGLLLDLGSPGLYARSAAFESVVQALVGRLTEHPAAPSGAWHFPPFLTRSAFERTGYLGSFPDLAGSVHVFVGGDREHAELLAAFERGEDWSRNLAPADIVLCSAGCHGIYPQLHTTLPEQGITVALVGQCFRHEPSPDPARMQAFRMHEVVRVGTPQAAREHRDHWLERAETFLRSLQLPVERVAANDPFFGRAGRILASGQLTEELKFEFVCEVANPEHQTAIASSNLHLDHFGEPFGIRTHDGRVAHSSCAAFGLERVTLALLRTHGMRIADWPATVRELLWPGAA